ncbi:hypothetical protein [Streptomyces sp. NPDC018693]|uniref:hypothetical protein n=1 Tax=unclassified Streptomyces TaxID=2593676 RepID=UPI00379304DF
MRRNDPRLETITEALHSLIPRATPAFLSLTLTETLPGTGEQTNTWTGRVESVAERIFTRLYGRPGTPPALSPLAQAEDAKRRRDLAGELGALMQAGTALESAPWYPCRPGDLVHVHYEAVGDVPLIPARGETYIVRDAGDGLMSMQLLADGSPQDTEPVDFFVVEAADCPIYDLWMEAGPHRLTIVRDGLVVHDGPGGRRQGPVQQAGKLLLAFGLTCTQAQRYLERGEPELALARLKSYKPLPPCGAPGFTAEQPDCARPRGHAGACSDDADYTDPPHECPTLPEQLHAVVTVGAKVTDVHFAGLYADRDAAADHAAGFSPWNYREDLTERYVKPAPGAPGEMVLELPAENELAATGVQLAVVVPLPLLPDPRAEDEWAAEGTDTALGPDDYAADYDDDYRDDE